MKKKTVQITTIHHNVDESYFNFLVSQLSKGRVITNNDAIKMRKGEKTIVHVKDKDGNTLTSTLFQVIEGKEEAAPAEHVCEKCGRGHEGCICEVKP